MPLKPLSKIPLTFLSDRNVEAGESPYDVLPWTNGSFRRLCGLKPLRPSDTDADADETEDPEQPSECVHIEEGLILTDEAMESMSEANRQFFTPESRREITSFLTEVRRHNEQLRQRESKPKNGRRGKKRGGKKGSTARDDTSDEESFVDRVDNIPGFKTFKGACLAMLNRAGGPIPETTKIMKDMDRTPMIAWKNFVYTSQRQADIDEKKAQLKLHNPPGIGKYLDDRLLIRVATLLFGAEAFMESSEILWECFDRATKSTIRRAWEREMREARKTLKKTAKAKITYEDDLKKAREAPCPRLLHKVSKSLRAWRDLAEITGESTEVKHKEIVSRLEDLWSDLGFSSDPTTAGAKGRRTTRLIRPLATAEQMEAAYVSYREQHFCEEMDDAVDEITTALQHLQGDTSAGTDLQPLDPIAVDLLQDTESCDIGVAEFAQTATNELLRLLGILKAATLPLASEHLEAKWHQIVGDSVMLKRFFTTNLGDPPTPTLLCDDVGLGKTAQILGVISMLVHCYELQEAGKPLPPLLLESARPYFAGEAKIPHRPSVILVPLGLVPQWYQQIQRFTIDGAFQVIEYSTTQFDPVTFFAPGGPWETHGEGKNCHRTIMLVPLSVVAAEAKKHIAELDKGATGRSRAFRGEVKPLGPDIPTILNKQFLFFGCDELHNLRNVSWAQVGALQVSSNSMVRVGATATPIFHGSMDLLAVGRILRLMTMIGNAGYELGMSMLKSERARRRQHKREEQDSDHPPQLNSRIPTAEASNPQDDFLARRLATVNADRHRTFFIHCEAIDMAKKELMPIIIRRTGESKDPAGNNILDLDRYYESIAWSPQREHEMRAVQRLMKALLDSQRHGDIKEMQIIWKNFLLDHKNTLFHWLLEDWKPDDRKFWMSWTVASLQNDASSKILTTINLIQHYQQPDAKPLFFNMDGTRDLTKEAGCDCKPANAARKVIVFVMYALHRKILKRALLLVGLQSVEYDGRMSTEARDQALKQFETDDDVRVLLMSNVGTTGLNLTMASVIIFLSGLWSGMEIKQTIGRVWRAGQILTVIIHHIFAPGTADVVLAALAGDKVLMLDHLYEAKTISDKLFNTDEDQDDSDVEWQGEDEATTSTSRRVAKTKASVRPRKKTHQDSPLLAPTVQLQVQGEPLQEEAAMEEGNPTASDEQDQGDRAMSPVSLETSGPEGSAQIGDKAVKADNRDIPTRPHKRPLLDEDHDEHKELSENRLGSQSQPASLGARPPKKVKASSSITDSLNRASQLASVTTGHGDGLAPPTIIPSSSHSPSSPTLITSPPRRQSLSPMSRSSSPVVPRVASPISSSQGSSPAPTSYQLNNSTTKTARIQNDSANPRPSTSTSSMPRLRHSQSHGPRPLQPSIQPPGQFMRKEQPKAVASIRLYSRNSRVMRSPSPSTCPPTGAAYRQSSSPSPPPHSKGKGKQV